MTLTTVLVLKGLLLHKNKVLIVKRSETDEHGAGNWSLPGGQLDNAESLADCLKREFREEVQLDVEPTQVLTTNSFKAREPHTFVVRISFLCSYSGADEPKVVLNEEHSEFLWVAIDADFSKYGKSIMREIEKYRETNNSCQ